MEYDIASVAEAILAALKQNTAFPESLSRRFSLAQGHDVQFELLKRRKARGDVHVGRQVGLTSRACNFSKAFTSPVWVTWSKPDTSPRQRCSASVT